MSARVVVQCALAILLAGTRHTGLLADARELRLDGEFDVAGFHSYPINFFTLPCVKSCRLLSLVSGYFSIRFHSMLIAWLFEDDANRKVFAIDIPGGDSDIINVILLNNMREDFLEAAHRAEFQLTLIVNLDDADTVTAYDSFEEINERTGEVLIVKSEDFTDRGMPRVRISISRRLLADHTA